MAVFGEKRADRPDVFAVPSKAGYMRDCWAAPGSSESGPAPAGVWQFTDGTCTKLTRRRKHLRPHNGPVGGLLDSGG